MSERSRNSGAGDAGDPAGVASGPRAAPEHRHGIQCKRTPSEIWGPGSGRHTMHHRRSGGRSRGKNSYWQAITQTTGLSERGREGRGNLHLGPQRGGLHR